MYKVTSQEELEQIKYMPKPNGGADVWLRANIEQETVEEDGVFVTIWRADETFLPDINMTLEEVQDNFSVLLLDYEKTKAEMTAVVQSFMDAKAQERGYDSILSVCSYVDTGVAKFDAEGAACRAWRSAVWNKCYAVLADVMTGERAIPTPGELIAELPELEW